jgi:Bacterial regulatory proteins, luxR family
MGAKSRNDPVDAGSADAALLSQPLPHERLRVASVPAQLSDPQVLEAEESTIRTHVKRILMKLGLRDRVQAVIFAYENGISIPGATASPTQS